MSCNHVPEITSRFVDCHVYRRGETIEWLVMKRAPHIILPNTWQPVQGHIEPGETAYEAAFRELQEETGLSCQKFYQASYVNRFYLAQTDQIILSPVFCAEVSGEVTLSDEHTEYKWVSFEEAMHTYPWPGQRKSLQICREQFLERTPMKESEISHLL